MNKYFKASIYCYCQKCFAVLVFLLLSFVSVSAQQFTAKFDRGEVAVGETFTVTYSLNDDGDDFRAPDFKGVDVLTGPNVSSSTRVINFKVSQNTSYSFVLRAKQQGQIIIPPAKVSADGKKLISNAIRINVIQGNTSAQKNQTQGIQDNNPFGKENVFIQLTPNKKEVFEGEALVVECKIYIRGLELQEYNLFKNPAFTGFWAEDVELPRTTGLSPERYNGKSYQAGIIKKVILYPQKSGILTIDPLSIECIARRNVGGSIFDDFFKDFSSGYIFDNFEPVRAIISSNVLKVKVNPLPGNQPEGFTGFVGKVNITAKPEVNSVRANEPVTYTVTINGYGNFNNIQAFDLKLENAEVFPPETEEKLKKENDIIGSKSFRYSIIPREEGKLFLPPVKLSYFDTDQDNYVTLQTNAFNIGVKKGLQAAAPSPNTKSGSNEDSDKSFWQNIPVLTWVAIAALPFAALLLFIVLKRKDKPKYFGEQSYMQEEKQAEAKEDISYHLSEAEEWFSRQHLNLFYESLWNAFTGWLRQKARLPLADLTHENIRQSLSANNFSPHETEHIISILQKLEFARYAPAVQQQHDAKALLDEVKHFLRA